MIAAFTWGFQVGRIQCRLLFGYKEACPWLDLEGQIK
jgi:hypothetical protein